MAGADTKINIGIYGRQNVGKSSLINSLTGQQISIVSDEKGTTTDPVKRSFEILDFGSVIFIDTAGIDDKTTIGTLRVEQTIKTLTKINLAIIVISHNEIGDYEDTIVSKCKQLDIPYFFIYNKSDISTINNYTQEIIINKYKARVITHSSTNPNNNKESIFQLIKEILSGYINKTNNLLSNLINKKDLIILVCPIDIAAPTGRLILPQVQTIRAALDNNCIAVVLQETELDNYLKNCNIQPKLVVTDSQIFKLVSNLVPNNIKLTSFSVLLAYQKGNFEKFILGTKSISSLQNGDNILILESCSHHVSCDDIGRVKIPSLLKKFTNKDLNFTFVVGQDDIPLENKKYSLAIHCGACMITNKQLHNRLQLLIDSNIPISNYGLAISYIEGIFDRAILPFSL